MVASQVHVEPADDDGHGGVGAAGDEEEGAVFGGGGKGGGEHHGEAAEGDGDGDEDEEEAMAEAVGDVGDYHGEAEGGSPGRHGVNCLKETCQIYGVFCQKLGQDLRTRMGRRGG